MSRSSTTLLKVPGLRAALSGVLCATGLLMAGCESDDDPPLVFGDNSPDVVVAAGDSITQNGYPPILAQISGKTVIDLGIGGADSAEGVAPTVSSLSRHSPGFLLIMFGANDVIGGDSFPQSIENLRAMIQAARANQTVPILGTLTPMIGLEQNRAGAVATLNGMIRALAASENVRLADIASAFGDGEEYMRIDGLHPNAAGHSLIARTFYAQMH